MYRTPFDFTDVVDAADVRMRDLPRGPDFVVKLREPDRLVTQRVGQKLQRDRLTEPEIVSPIHLAHAAFAEQADDAIAAVEQRAWRETAVADRVGRGQPAAVGFRSGRGRCWRAAADDADRSAAGSRVGCTLTPSTRQRLVVLRTRRTAGGTEPGAVGKRRGATARKSRRGFYADRQHAQVAAEQGIPGIRSQESAYRAGQGFDSGLSPEPLTTLPGQP